MKIKKNNKYKKVLIDNKEYVIPVEWNIKNLKSLSQKIGDGLHGSPKYSTVETRFYFINGNNLKKGGVFINDATKMINEEEYKKYKKDISENTILLSINGTVGNVSLLQEQDINFILSKSVAYINPSEQINKHYLFYVLKSFIFRKYIDLTSTGSTIKNLSLTSIRDFNLSFPNINEQENIVNVLLKQESIISNIEKLISKTEKIFDYFKNELLSGRKIIDFENMEVNSINSSNKLDLKTVKLSDIISFSMGNTPKKVDDNYNGDIPWITISNLKSKYINNYTAFVKNSKSIKIIPKDTLIGSFKMSVGRFGFTTENCCTNEAIIAIKKEDTKENLDYLYYLLPKYFNDNAEKNGQGIPLLNSKKIKDIIVNIPKLEEQNKIVDFLKKYENLIENQKKLLEKEKQKFEWLSEKLLSGEYLVVEEQE